MFERLKKTAEPPPPEGVSSAEWDKALQKMGPAVEKAKTAAKLKKEGQASFEELVGLVTPPSPDEVLEMKLADARMTDRNTLKIAQTMRPLGSTYEVLELYEGLGGTFSKEAFGAPMFSQMAAPSAPAPKAAPAPAVAPAQSSSTASPAVGAANPTMGAVRPPVPPSSPGGGSLSSTGAVKAPATGINVSGASGASVG